MNGTASFPFSVSGGPGVRHASLPGTGYRRYRKHSQQGDTGGQNCPYTFGIARCSGMAPLLIAWPHSARARRCAGRVAGWSRQVKFLQLWGLNTGWQPKWQCRTRITPGIRCSARCAGTKFSPVILTNHGGWYYHSNDFSAEVTHNGDKADSFNIEAERFDHYLHTWASWQHSVFLIQAVSCSMAQAAYVAMVNQSKKDLATESGGRSAFQSFGSLGGVQPPSPKTNRP